MFNGTTRGMGQGRRQFVIRLEAAFRNGWRRRPIPSGTTPPPGRRTRTPTACCCGPAADRAHPCRPVHRPPSRRSCSGCAGGAPFHGRWLWTDAAGRTQPAVTLFDGQYRSENPYRAALVGTTATSPAAARIAAAAATCRAIRAKPPAGRAVQPAHAAGEIDADRLVREPARPSRRPCPDGRGQAVVAAKRRGFREAGAPPPVGDGGCAPRARHAWQPMPGAVSLRPAGRLRPWRAGERREPRWARHG